MAAGLRRSPFGSLTFSCPGRARNVQGTKSTLASQSAIESTNASGEMLPGLPMTSNRTANITEPSGTVTPRTFGSSHEKLNLPSDASVLPKLPDASPSSPYCSVPIKRRTSGFQAKVPCAVVTRLKSRTVTCTTTLVAGAVVTLLAWKLTTGGPLFAPACAALPTREKSRELFRSPSLIAMKSWPGISTLALG